MYQLVNVKTLGALALVAVAWVVDDDATGSNEPLEELPALPYGHSPVSGEPAVGRAKLSPPRRETAGVLVEVRGRSALQWRAGLGQRLVRDSYPAWHVATREINSSRSRSNHSPCRRLSA